MTLIRNYFEFEKETQELFAKSFFKQKDYLNNASKIKEYTNIYLMICNYSGTNSVNVNNIAKKVF